MPTYLLALMGTSVDLPHHHTLVHAMLFRLVVYDPPLSSKLLMSVLAWQAEVLGRAALK